MSATMIPSLDPADVGWRTDPSKLLVVKAVGRRMVPYLIEATIIPTALFYVFLITFELKWAIVAALGWTYAAIGRRLVTGSPISGLLVLATLGISVRTVVYLLSGNSFVYFLQPIMRTVATSAVFALSVCVGRPLIARFAGDFCPLTPDLQRRTAVVRLFRRLTYLWAGVNAVAAAATLTLLLTVPVAVFVVTATISAWIITCSGVVLTVSDAVRTARGEGLHTAIAPNGRMHAYVAPTRSEDLCPLRCVVSLHLPRRREPRGGCDSAGGRPARRARRTASTLQSTDPVVDGRRAAPTRRFPSDSSTAFAVVGGAPRGDSTRRKVVGLAFRRRWSIRARVCAGQVIATPLYRRLWRVRVEGGERLPCRGPAILAANHVSFFDSVVLIMTVRRTLSFVGKVEYLDSWKTRRLLPACGMIPVDRRDGRRAVAALKIAAGVLRAGRMFAIYPEGTRSADGDLHAGHTGAAYLSMATGVPILPTGIVGTDRVQPPGTRVPRPFRPVTVRFGHPIDPAAYTGSRRHRRRLITTDVMTAIQALSGQTQAEPATP